MKNKQTEAIEGRSRESTEQGEGGLAAFGARLVTLCDGRRGLRRGLAVETRAAPADAVDAAATIDFLSSSEQLDRYDEILTTSGWRLDNYRRNPVFQNAHQYGDILFTLGKALITEVRVVGGRPVLFQRIEFAVSANPIARIAYGLYRGKFLNAVSVGFIPLRWENGGEQAGYRRKYLEQELLEVSAVGIPANPEALQLGLRSGAIDRADLRQLRDLLAGLGAATPFCSRTAGAATDTRAWGADANEAHWLQLARAIQAAMANG